MFVVLAMLGCAGIKPLPTSSPTPSDGVPTATATPEVIVPDPADLALPPPGSVDNGRFSTSDTCAACHSNASTANAMRDEDDRGVAPFDLWQSSMMANAGRDPLWRAFVSAEIKVTPGAADVIGTRCMTCHSPMAESDARLVGDPDPLLSVLTDGTERTDLALDGVSCTLCHQIEPDNLGTETSFSGGYVINAENHLYGPHNNPSTSYMEAIGWTPVQSDHLTQPTLCATCHTLTTEALNADGTYNGGHVVEQAPYLEMLNSVQSSNSCQRCHLPTTSQDNVTLSTPVARAPDGLDYALGPRQPYGRHLLVGGNTLIPAILRDYRDVLQPRASDAAFDATIAAARNQLENNTAELDIRNGLVSSGVLTFETDITVLAGHKFPTGIPLRRAWLMATVTDNNGNVIFETGMYDAEGRLLDENGQLQAFEQLGGPINGHRHVIDAPGQVQIYEAVLADLSGNPTFRLLRGAGYYKDDRLLPEGWSDSYVYIDRIRPFGVDGDPDYDDGGDKVEWTVSVSGTSGPWTIDVALLFQTLSPRVATELFAVETRETAAFKVMYESADRSPEVIATATQQVN